MKGRAYPSSLKFSVVPSAVQTHNQLQTQIQTQKFYVLCVYWSVADFLNSMNRNKNKQIVNETQLCHIT